MKSRTTLLLFTSFGWLTLIAGCGKTDTTPPPPPEASTPAAAPKPEPAPTPAQLAATVTNAAAAAVDTAKTAIDSAVKAAAGQAPSATLTAPPATAAGAPTPTAAPSPAGQAQVTLASLSSDQMVKGLQEALAKGLQQAIAGLGHDGGFLTNLNVKIPIPEKMQKVESALRAVNQQKLADDFVATMNHAAEQAVPEAGSVFADALKQMTIEDAKSILSGPNDAATQYFQKTTQTNLYAKFYPIVQKATEKTGVTAAYKLVMEKAGGAQGLGTVGNLLGSSVLGKESLDIDAYVTSKAMDGLFKMVAQEELQIRQNPVARTTVTLQKVFGALRQ